MLSQRLPRKQKFKLFLPWEEEVRYNSNSHLRAPPLLSVETLGSWASIDSSGKKNTEQKKTSQEE